MNRDQFDCKFKQYETLHAPEDEGGSRIEEDGARATTRTGAHPLQVVAVGRRGFSLLIDGMPRFLAFRDHPAFANASVEELRHVQRPQRNRLYWPELGVRLEIGEIRAKNKRPAGMDELCGSAVPAA